MPGLWGNDQGQQCGCQGADISLGDKLAKHATDGRDREVVLSRSCGSQGIIRDSQMFSPKLFTLLKFYKEVYDPFSLSVCF